MAHCSQLPVDVLFVRDDDIPGLVMDRVVDIGIVGRNVLREEALSRANAGEPGDCLELTELDFGVCRVSIAIPEDREYSGPAALANNRIATSYPNLLAEYLRPLSVDYEACGLNGAVEIAPRAGLADAICDIVSTGATLEANGLREVETIFNSTAVLIRCTGTQEKQKEDLVLKLLTRFKGVMSARESKYIMLHAPTEKLAQIVSLLPGAEDPTILNLSSCTDKVAVHVVSRENLFWETMEKLQELGATSILVLPIEKMLA